MSEQARAILDQDDSRSKILLNLSRLSGAPPHHILFGANALEWIPVRAGGKKSDHSVTQDELARFADLLGRTASEPPGVTAVLSETNALIRFLNWLPLVECPENFSGRFWAYSSVCDTENSLFQILCDNPEAWKDPCFADAFHDKLAPQLRYLDASSARGRFLLQLILNERRIKDEFFCGLDESWRQRAVRKMVDPDNEKVQDQLVDVLRPRSISGGKSFGLALAALKIGAQKILHGFYVSSSGVEDFLKSCPILWQAILELDARRDISGKLGLARTIQKRILRQMVPNWLEQSLCNGMHRFEGVDLWAVRSSSQEESEARGVYETLLRVPAHQCKDAFRKCVASFFSDAAVHFRFVAGASDIPLFSVLLQPYCELPGGGGRSEFQDAELVQLMVSTGTTAESVTSGKEGVREWRGSQDEAADAPDEVKGVLSLLSLLSCAFSAVQIEWMLNTEVSLLQMEILPTEQRMPSLHYYSEPEIISLRPDQIDVSVIVHSCNGDSRRVYALRVEDVIPLPVLQNILLELHVHLKGRVVEVQFPEPISPSSHFANICKYLDVRCSVF